ncbi:MAG: prephenate dehydrogenase/arogenate dehydrogenase family protein [Candidatus Nitrosocaldus sp.]|nr:prephenate dehydrogenase/arogenate dehydrogenase family protein [Candidatus Nitrosocaldus sp.]MDW7999586.1 prephenate dehydrogenase/arogenate dehydrogenase family protein [Candidatus Nitrosocaldus sp.]
MDITIIGAGGRMGSWFTRYFHARGHNIYINDIDMEALRSLYSSLAPSGKRGDMGIEGVVVDGARRRGGRVGGGEGEEEEGEGEGRVTILDSSLLDGSNYGSSILDSSDLIMLSLPMDTIPKMVPIVARHMRKGSTLVEISSIKHDAHRAMRRAAERYGIRPLSIHPLFGPGADINASNRFVLVPVLDGEEEQGTARTVFPDATMIVVDGADEHDRVMALVLGMVYAMNVAFVDLFGGCDDIALCKRLAGSTFTLQSLILEGILNDDPALFSSLLMNRHVKRYLRRFISSNRRILESIDAKDGDALKRVYARAKRKMGGCTDIEGSYRLMYRVLRDVVAGRGGDSGRA